MSRSEKQMHPGQVTPQILPPGQSSGGCPRLASRGPPEPQSGRPIGNVTGVNMKKHFAKR
ncbi:hypothetical protein BC937DRAFT_90099 [Endogone sp. FLAS-F59071]|nr:hypothetical protein BC937DRAFT_90099 [Endogone sp. FLAS-F59071]|eukprot:RUS22182.1 hypothetical protein BC937DRAFT_90099 [Endogone sp. FLAS-F59071]